MAGSAAATPTADWPDVGTIEVFETRPEKAPFSAEFLANSIIRIKYGTDLRHTRRIPREVLERLATRLRGQRVPPSGEGSVHEYLADRRHETFFSETRLASYVCPLLVYLDFAAHDGDGLRFH